VVIRLAGVNVKKNVVCLVCPVVSCNPHTYYTLWPSLHTRLKKAIIKILLFFK
jgi:hypothetical protein